MKPNDLVLVPTGPPGQAMHVVARYLHRFDTESDRVWLDMNMGGVHLPQWYRLDEIERVWDAAPHGFCPDCKGFGIPEGAPSDVGSDQREKCPTCGGSGRPMVSMTIEHPNDSTTEAHVQIDSKAVDEIECDVCRAALTPR